MEITLNEIRDFFNGTINLIKTTKTGIKIYKSCITKSGEVSKNPHLFGFIAENHHTETFNFNAKKAHSEYVAKSPVPEHGFAKNSMDIGVYKNGKGIPVRKYQAKYSSSPEKAKAYYQHGNYNQRLLVADGQEKVIKGATNKITSPDGISSDPLSYEQAKNLQNKIQSGNYPKHLAKEFTAGAAKEVGKGALLGMAIDATTESISLFKDFKQGKISGDEYIKKVVKTAAIGGITGALTSAVMIPITAALSIANVAVPFVAIPVSFFVGSRIRRFVVNKFEEFEKDHPDGLFLYDNAKELVEDACIMLADTAESISLAIETHGEGVLTTVGTVAEPVVTGAVNAVENVAEDAKNQKIITICTIIGGILGIPGGLIGIIIGLVCGYYIGKALKGTIKVITIVIVTTIFVISISILFFIGFLILLFILESM